MKTRIRFGFKGKNQMPLFMLWKEYWEDGEVYYAEVLFEIDQIMKVGTKSLLFGVHQFIVHPIVVYRGWKALYGRPTWKELICIIIHDWGYWGKPNMDGPEGEKHTEWAARVAGKLLGQKYHDLCLYHSRHYSRRAGVEPSPLCWADKLHMVTEPRWFYLFRARLTGELKEYRKNTADAGYVPMELSDNGWFDWCSIWLAKQGIRQKSAVKLVNPDVNGGSTNAGTSVSN